MKEKKKRSASEIGKSSKALGKRMELQLSHIWQEAGWKDCKRSVQVSGRGQGRGDLINVDPLNIECKCVDRLNIHSAYDQAVQNAEGTNEIPVVCFKRKREDWKVCLSLTDFIHIFRKAYPPEGGGQDGK